MSKPRSVPRTVPHPDETTSWEAFKRLPAPAVALDGYVTGPTRVGPTHATFDHHTGVDRLATRATCEQIALALRFGGVAVLDDLDRLDVHVNHADEDVCLSVWLLGNPRASDDADVRRLLETEGVLDTTGGCHVPRSDHGFLETFAWVFEPCRTRPADALSIAATIGAVGERIDAYLAGSARRVRVTSGFEVVHRRGRVAAVVERGPLARIGLADAGIDVYVSLWDRDGVLHATVGKTSPYAPYDLVRAFDELNRREDPARGAWGGGETIGGSPRRGGTGLDVEDIVAAIDASRDERTAPLLTHRRS